jgi:hypothetical protein
VPIGQNAREIGEDSERFIAIAVMLLLYNEIYWRKNWPKTGVLGLKIVKISCLSD